MEQPGTVIGRRLAGRALTLASRTRADRPTPLANRALIDLTQREPLPPPAHIGEAAKAALNRGETHYTSRPGVPELRSAIAARSTAEGFPATADGVVITNGGAEALYIALQSVLKRGDRALVAGPVAPNITDMIDFIGAERMSIGANAHSRVAPDIDELSQSDASVLLIGSPSPITGIAILPDTLREVVAVAVDRGMAVILDRTLAWCAYDPVLARFPAPELAAKVLTIGSFSIAWGMDGWRVGYFTAPAEHIAGMRELKQAMSICTSAVSQFAAVAALENAEPWLAERRATFSERLATATNILSDAGIGVVRPDAWPFLLLDTRLIHPDDVQAVTMIASDAGIHVEPASPYTDMLAGYVRLRLDAPEQQLVSGLERLVTFHNTCL